MAKYEAEQVGKVYRVKKRSGIDGAVVFATVVGTIIILLVAFNS